MRLQSGSPCTPKNGLKSALHGTGAKPQEGGDLPSPPSVSGRWGCGRPGLRGTRIGARAQLNFRGLFDVRLRVRGHAFESSRFHTLRATPLQVRLGARSGDSLHDRKPTPPCICANEIGQGVFRRNMEKGGAVNATAPHQHGRVGLVSRSSEHRDRTVARCANRPRGGRRSRRSDPRTHRSG